MKQTIHYLFFIVLISAFVSCSTSKSHLHKKKHKRSEVVLAKKQNSKKQPPPSEPIISNPKHNYHKIIDIASNLVGTPYKYGGKSPSGLDCSGFVTYVYNQAGYSLQGSSKTLSAKGKSISKSAAQPGDLIFFYKNGTVFHVSLVVENKNQDLWVVHSTSSKGVIKENIFASSYWGNKEYSLRNLIN